LIVFIVRWGVDAADARGVLQVVGDEAFEGLQVDVDDHLERLAGPGRVDMSAVDSPFRG
jgi:hypothetical protein